MKRALALVAVSAVALAVAASASAHARISPSVGLAKQLELYSLAVPTEKEGKRTTKIVLTVPSGFAIDSFVAAPGWQREVKQTGSGEQAVVNTVTWTGGSVPAGEDALFEFLAQAQSSKTYTFSVEQTYSDGEIVSWTGPESADDPSPTVEAKGSLGGAGSSTLAIVALVVGAVGILLGGLALVAKSGRPLA